MASNASTSLLCTLQATAIAKTEPTRQQISRRASLLVVWFWWRVHAGSAESGPIGPPHCSPPWYSLDGPSGAPVALYFSAATMSAATSWAPLPLPFEVAGLLISSTARGCIRPAARCWRPARREVGALRRGFTPPSKSWLHCMALAIEQG